MSLKQRLQKDMVAAMKAGDKSTRNALRLMMAAIKQVEIDEQKELDDAGVLEVLTRQAKQRRESMADYEKANKPERAAEEKVELDVIQAYLPQMMSEAEIRAIAEPLIAELGVTDARGMGQVMGRLMPKVKGKADGRLVNQVVRGILQGQ